MSEPELIDKFKRRTCGQRRHEPHHQRRPGVPHGKVVHVIDLAKLQGILKFAINVEPVK